MELNLTDLKNLMHPLLLGPDHPDHYRLLVDKCSVLLREKVRLMDTAKDYLKFAEPRPLLKMTVGRRIVNLFWSQIELKEIMYKVHYGEVGVEWLSDFEWDYCLDILKSLCNHIDSVSASLDEEFIMAALSGKSSEGYILTESARKCFSDN